MGSDRLEIISNDEAIEILKSDWARDFWREGGFHESIPDSLFYISSGKSVFVIERAADCCGIHAAIHPDERGVKAVEAAKKVISRMLSLFPRVLARIQSDRPEVIRFAQLSGMVEYNSNKTHRFFEVTTCH